MPDEPAPKPAKRRLPRIGLRTGLAIVALIAWFLLRPKPEPPRPTGPLVGKSAPEIADDVERWVNGDEVDIADLGGKVVLLYFWHPRDGRSPATLDGVQALAARYADDGLVVIGLCVCDEPSDVQPLIDGHRLTFRIALDSDGDVHIRKYRIDQTGTPYCYLVGPDRLIAWQGPPADLTPRRIRDLLP